MDQCVMYSESHMFPYKFVQRALHLKIGQKPISAMYITHVRVCMIDRFNCNRYITISFYPNTEAAFHIICISKITSQNTISIPNVQNSMQ